MGAFFSGYGKEGPQKNFQILKTRYRTTIVREP
jgi:hypothetical protein